MSRRELKKLYKVIDGENEHGAKKKKDFRRHLRKECE